MMCTWLKVENRARVSAAASVFSGLPVLRLQAAQSLGWQGEANGLAKTSVWNGL
jgi:hypothetical protein